jgi:dolichyl-phosphate-mannose--protein O-mannosyl transferase
MLEFILYHLRARKWQPEVIGLVIAAFLTRFWNLFTPNAVVFDEVYFKMFCAHYLDGHYFFDIHPPLAKLIVAAQAKLFMMPASALLNGTAVQLRLLPALAGALLVPLVWGILRRLSVNRALAFLGAAAVLLDNALLVESRFILMDSMLLLFGLGAFYFYLRARTGQTDRRGRWLILAALSAGAAASTKWTGLTALALILILWLYDTRRHFTWGRRLKELAILLIIPTLVYVGSFWIHFALMPQSGDGDAFMSVNFQQTLVGNASYKAGSHMSFLSKFVELNREMYEANRTLTATHPYSSLWYSWPLDVRPVYYWQGAQLPNGRQGNIYLLGNPIIWWGVLLAAVAGILCAYRRQVRLPKPAVWSLVAVGIAYLLNFLPFVPITRVMFIYHYFFAFIFSIAFVVILWNALLNNDNVTVSKPVQKRLFIGVFALMLFGFIYFMPISYGLPLTPGELQAHVWLPTWR